jgi:hypothetical protein
MGKKVVRFYDLRHIQSSTVESSPEEVASGFWTKLHERVEKLSPRDRRILVGNRRVIGEARTGVRPATPYFYIGAIRDRAEWPDTIQEDTGVFGELSVDGEGKALAEPAYVVPFGAENQVAVLSMSAGSPRANAIESWVTAALSKRAGYDGMLMLLPIVNDTVRRRLGEASGATKFQVKIHRDAPIPEGGGGLVGRAARAAQEVSTETDLELVWSLGNRAGSTDTTSQLLDAARWVREDFVKSASVGLIWEENGRTRRKTYDLLKEVFTSKQEFEIRSNEPPSELSVLTGINKAIDQFRKEFS